MKRLIVILVSINCGLLQSQEDLLSSILNHLDISQSEILKELYSEKILPYNKHYTIYAIPVVTETIDHSIANSIEKEEYIKADLHIVELNNLTHSITRHCLLEDEIQFDATGPSSIIIDAAPYHVNERSVALAIRIEHSSSSWEWFAFESFILLERDNSSFKEIFRTVGKSTDVINRFNCLFDFLKETKIFIIDKDLSINGYHPIEVKNTYVQQLTDSNCVYTVTDHTAMGQLLFVDSSYQYSIKLPDISDVFPVNKDE